MADETLPPLPTVPPSASAQNNDMLWIMACHLSLFFGVGFLLPFIVYLAKRRDSELVAAHAKEVLNFHISLVIYGIIFALLCALLIGIPLLIGLVIAAFVCPIIASIRASEGGFYRYPLTIRMI